MFSKEAPFRCFFLRLRVIWRRFYVHCWVYKHTDGYYYFTATVPEYDRIELRRATTIQGLKEAAPVVVWRKNEAGPNSANIWAQRDPAIESSSNLYISKMSNPWTLAGEQVMISTPEYDWETVGYRVNEGPAVLKRNGRIFICYSASATDFNYCMGLLEADETANLLDPSVWRKFAKPVFSNQ